MLPLDLTLKTRCSTAIPNQRGAALITALLLAALVSITAVAMMSRQQIDIRRTGNVLHGDQALLLAGGMEAWGCRLLARSTQEEERAYLQGMLPPLVVEGGLLSGRLQDVQGLFNLNNLVLGDQDRQDHSREQFGRLLDSCGLEPELTGAVVDWLDPDGELFFPGGGEDSYYQGLTPASLAANAPMQSGSELALVAGFDRPEYRDCLAPLVCALPVATDLNVNSAPPLVLASLSDRLDRTAAEILVEERPDQGHASVAEFLQQGILAGTGIQDRYLDVRSRFFVVHSEARLEKSRISLSSLLERTDRQVRVLRRSRGPL